MSNEQATVHRGAMNRSGVFTLPEQSWAVDLSLLARSVNQLVAAGWPPTFIWVFDEPWVMLAQIAPILKEVTGAEVCFEMLASHVLPGETGVSFRRERPLAGFKGGGGGAGGLASAVGSELGFHSDGTPAFAVCWVPLVEVPPTSSCLMCVPRGQDPGYMETANLHWGQDMLRNIRALSMGEGGACIFSHRLFHWGKTADPLGADGKAAAPLVALSFAVADDAFEKPCLPRRVLPLPPRQLRVALAAGQSIVHGAADKYDGGKIEVLWNCFLACSEHFDPAFCERVLKAKCVGQSGNP